MGEIQLHDTHYLLNLPDPEWLVQDFIHCEEAVAIWGQPNMGKTFISLDMALSVASGLDFLGVFPVKQVPVVYMAGEGGASLKKRVSAWMEFKGIDEVPGAYWQLRSIPFRDEKIVEEVIDAFANYVDDPLSPSHAPGVNVGLVVIDTLSQFFSGGDENGPDMALFVANVRDLCQDAGLAAIIVHHGNATGGRERGNSALRGNVDVMFEVQGFKKDQRLLGMSMLNDKNRDNPAAPKTYMSVKAVGQGLVLIPSDAQRIAAAEHALVLDDPKLVELLRGCELVEDGKNETCLHNDLIDQCGLKRQRLHEYLKTLMSLGLVVKAGRGKSALTLLGRDTLATTLRAQQPSPSTYGRKE